ncbi:hypothetical protein EYC80_005144 [Monilinia laxa]|uniref:Uncharacterized protein n=1 Tax=Monilinia laxa TaxID=61186 RepID=A0A5N6KJ04_MONLA|nr:hypothetical protein EYC80_005144 [Monilinia laxa]
MKYRYQQQPWFAPHMQRGSSSASISDGEWKLCIQGMGILGLVCMNWLESRGFAVGVFGIVLDEVGVCSGLDLDNPNPSPISYLPSPISHPPIPTSKKQNIFPYDQRITSTLPLTSIPTNPPNKYPPTTKSRPSSFTPQKATRYKFFVPNIIYTTNLQSRQTNTSNLRTSPHHPFQIPHLRCIG